MNSGAIILAAGSSSRMGKSKQMLDIRGEKLLVRTVQSVLNAGVSHVVVVLGSNEQEHRKILKDFPIEIVSNPDWKSGMGSSLKAGLKHLIAIDHALDSVIVSVCDQPLLTLENISNLMAKYQQTQKPVIASRYSGMPGVPALFDKSFFGKLSILSDDQGAKKIILQHRTDVSEVDFPGGEIDLDTMEDYEAFRKREG